MDGRRRSDRLPEDSVEPILSRAAQLDKHQRETVDVDLVRSAAVEAGISLDAVDRAVAEYEAGIEPASPGSEELIDPRTTQSSGAGSGWKLIGIVLSAMATAMGIVLVTRGGDVRPAILLLLVALTAALLGRMVFRPRRPGDPTVHDEL